MTGLSAKVAVVTGASKGIGAGIARAFATAGASVVVNYASNAVDAATVVDDIVAAGGTAMAVQANVSSAEDVSRLFAETMNAYGRLDVLVNNAGIYIAEPTDDATEDHFQRQFCTNVLGSILTIQQALRHFGPGNGSIVNIGSRPWPCRS